MKKKEGLILKDETSDEERITPMLAKHENKRLENMGEKPREKWLTIKAPGQR